MPVYTETAGAARGNSLGECHCFIFSDCLATCSMPPTLAKFTHFLPDIPEWFKGFPYKTP